jgi:hypothetical protein
LDKNYFDVLSSGWMLHQCRAIKDILSRAKNKIGRERNDIYFTLDYIPFNNAIFLSSLGKIFNNDSSLLYSEYLSSSVFTKK